MHQMMPATNLCSSKMAFYDSRLYLDTLSPLGLMMYIVDAGRWEHIPAKFPRSLLDGVRECDGRSARRHERERAARGHAIEAKQAARDGIETTKIIQQPTVDAGTREGILDVGKRLWTEHG